MNENNHDDNNDNNDVMDAIDEIDNNNNENNENDNNYGIILHSHTRGFEIIELNSDGHEQDSDLFDDNGRNGNEMGAAGDDVYQEIINNNQRNDVIDNIDGFNNFDGFGGNGSMGIGMGFGAGFDSDLSNRQIVNSNQREHVRKDGSGNVNIGNVSNNNVNRNMGNGNIISDVFGVVQNFLLDDKIKNLKEKATETTEKAVDNKAYTVNNPSMDNL